MAKARPIPDLGEDDPFATVAARVVEQRARELIEHAHDVLDTTDIERVHDMRVATRRLRAALEVFEPCFPRKRHKAALREVKALADALGRRRDPDVTLEELDRFADGAGPADRPGVRSLAATLRDDQARANLELARMVTPERLAALGERLAGLAAAADALIEVPSGRVASRAVGAPPRPVEAPGESLAGDPAPATAGEARAAEPPARPGRLTESAPAAINGDEPR